MVFQAHWRLAAIQIYSPCLLEWEGKLYRSVIRWYEIIRKHYLRVWNFFSLDFLFSLMILVRAFCVPSWGGKKQRRKLGNTVFPTVHFSLSSKWYFWRRNGEMSGKTRKVLVNPCLLFLLSSCLRQLMVKQTDLVPLFVGWQLRMGFPFLSSCFHFMASPWLVVCEPS